MLAKVVRQADQFVKHDLVVGDVYHVDFIDMDRWYTDIYIAGKPSPYNSVIFEFYENGDPIDIYNDPKYNPFMLAM